MKLHTYFRIIGFVELLGFAIGVIWYIVDLVTAAYLTRGLTLGLSLLILAIIIFFGPAVGLLFFAVANVLEEKEIENNEKMLQKKHQNIGESTNAKQKCKFRKGNYVILVKDVIAYNHYHLKIEKGEVGYVENIIGKDLSVIFKINGEDIEVIESFDCFEIIDD